MSISRLAAFTVSASVAVLSIAASAQQPQTPFAGLPGAPDDVCRPVAEQQLPKYGLSLAQLSNASWVTNQQPMGQGRSQITGYTLAAQPPGCSAGTLYLDFFADCSFNQIYTKGGCQVSGVPGF